MADSQRRRPAAHLVQDQPAVEHAVEDRERDGEGGPGGQGREEPGDPGPDHHRAERRGEQGDRHLKRGQMLGERHGLSRSRARGSRLPRSSRRPPDADDQRESQRGRRDRHDDGGEDQDMRQRVGVARRSFQHDRRRAVLDVTDRDVEKEHGGLDDVEADDLLDQVAARHDDVEAGHQQDDRAPLDRVAGQERERVRHRRRRSAKV